MIETYAVRTVTDNYEPPRGEAWLSATRYVDEDRPAASKRHPVIVLSVFGAVGVLLRDAHSSVYLWDDGESVTPFYVAGWHGAEDGKPDRVFLHPVMPLPNNGRSNLHGWALGPRRCYHLKVTRTYPEAENL